MELAEFSLHYAMLGVYTLLHHAASAAQLRAKAESALAEAGGDTSAAHSVYRLTCALDALAYGSGLDGDVASEVARRPPPPPPSGGRPAARGAARMCAGGEDEPSP